MVGRDNLLKIMMLMFLVLALTAGPGTAISSLRSETAERAQAGLARVDSLLTVGQSGEAVALAVKLQEQLGTDPLYGWQIEGRLGLALLRDGRPDQAVPHLEAVMRRDPNDPVAHRNLANALLAIGKKGRALTEFSLAVDLGPDDYETRLEYGQVLAEFRDVRNSGSSSKPPGPFARIALNPTWRWRGCI